MSLEAKLKKLLMATMLIQINLVMIGCITSQENPDPKLKSSIPVQSKTFCSIKYDCQFEKIQFDSNGWRRVISVNPEFIQIMTEKDNLLYMTGEISNSRQHDYNDTILVGEIRNDSIIALDSGLSGDIYISI